MIECVHAYWLLLWLIGLFSRYSHRNCIINYPRRCHGGTMESPDEYLGRLNFPGARSFEGAPRVALLRWRDGGGSERCVCACLCCAARFLPSLKHKYTHTQQWGWPSSSSSSSIVIDFVSVSLYCNFISVMSADGGPGERTGVCLRGRCSKGWTSAMPPLVMLAASPPALLTETVKNKRTLKK